MALRRCVEDRCPAWIESGSRCRGHEAERKRIRNADRVLHRAVVDAWVAEHGWVCPGWRRPRHPASDLTAAHVVPMSRSRRAGGRRTVLCRSCNASQGTNAG